MYHGDVETGLSFGEVISTYALSNSCYYEYHYNQCRRVLLNKFEMGLCPKLLAKRINNYKMLVFSSAWFCGRPILI
jgi:hypothetical protein